MNFSWTLSTSVQQVPQTRISKSMSHCSAVPSFFNLQVRINTVANIVTYFLSPLRLLQRKYLQYIMSTIFISTPLGFHVSMTLIFLTIVYIPLWWWKIFKLWCCNKWKFTSQKFENRRFYYPEAKFSP